MPDENNLVLCYNRGCGQTFDLSKNSAESCRHHPGAPVFHDAYKGWSCCNKKCTDFTEFLNIKGCAVSYHNNIKPAEPEKPKTTVPDDEVIEYRAPITEVQEERPPFDTPMEELKSSVAESLKKDLAELGNSRLSLSENDAEPTTIPLGTPCKNNSCKVVYEGPQTNSKCMHHPGCPVFHEGLKFWSCCTKRTTDFNAFLEQVGCRIGEHTWFKKKDEGEAKCRLDWHQTGSEVYVTIYSKKCDPTSSSVHLSPVRLKLVLYFPEQNATFSKDFHLMRMVNVKKSSVSYYSSKVEIKLAKLEPGKWSKLEVPSDKPSDIDNEIKNEPAPINKPINDISEQVESVDLSCI